MSKLIKKYQELKNNDSNKLYIFKLGIFYVFLAEDADVASDALNLKLTKLNDSVYKCGFPITSQEKYFKIIEKLEKPYMIVEDLLDYKNSIINKIKNINLSSMTQEEAFCLINEFHEMIRNNG